MKLHPATFEFLKAINEQNSRKYFATVRDLYDDIRANLKNISLELIQEATKLDSQYEGLQPKDCMYRIYRDARRLKPGDQIYKNNFAIAIAGGGKMAKVPAYCLQIEPGDKSFFCGGIYRPTGDHLLRLRKYLRKHGDSYKKIINQKKITKTFGQLTGATLTNPPRGFSEDDNHIDLIKMKQHLFFRPISDEEILTVDITKLCAKYMYDLREWLDVLEIGCTYTGE